MHFGMKVCCKCKESKLVAEFNLDKSRRDGRRNRCRDCDKKMYRAYERSEGSQARRRAYDTARNLARDQRNREHREKWATDPALRLKAVQAVGNAITSGRLVAGPCAHRCRGKCRGGVEGHHWSYLEEHWLDVIWLCKGHHVVEHQRLRAVA